MKWTKFIFLVLFTAFISSHQIAAANTEDKGKLKELINNWTLAINNKDFNSLAKLFTDDLQIITPDHQIIKSKEEFQRYFESMFSSKKSIYKEYTVDADIFKNIKFLSDDVAVMSGVVNANFTLAENNQKMHLQKYWTAILIKDKGDWKISSLHSSINATDKFAVGTSYESPTLSLIFAASLGFFLGALITAMMRNKQHA